VRWGNDEFLVNLAEDETENANFKLKNGAVFEQLKLSYENWDRQMLSIPPEVRRGPWENQQNRARNLEHIRR
jgi:hypothetical protein